LYLRSDIIVDRSSVEHDIIGRRNNDKRG